MKVLLVLLACVSGMALISAVATRRFEARFNSDVAENLERTKGLQSHPLTEQDLERLPPPVQKYLRLARVLGKPSLKSAKIAFQGRMRGKKQDYFPFNSVQYNFFDVPTRLFYMKGKMFGITVPGYHRYREEAASMDIRLFGILPVAQFSGRDLTVAETVTLFNDMCLLALIFPRFSGHET